MGFYLRLKDGVGWWERNSVGERTEARSVSPVLSVAGQPNH